MTQPGGTAPSAYDSNVSVHGSGWTTRARASPLSAPTVALIVPACSTGSAATVNVPSVDRAFQPLERPRRAGLLAQEAALARRTAARAASPSVRASAPARSATPARTPARRRLSPPAASTAEPVDGLRASSVRWRRRASLETKKMRPRDTAAPAENRLGRALRPAGRCLLLSGSSTSLSTSRAIGERPDDEELAAFGADVELAVGEHERRLLHRAERLRPELACRSRRRTPSAASRSRSDRRACRR